MKMRAPKGEGALTLDELDGQTRGLIALAGRDLLGSRNSASAGSSIRSSACSGAATCMSRFSVISCATKRPTTACWSMWRGTFHVPVVATNGVRFADPAERPLFDVLTCIHHKTTLAQAGKKLARNAERYLKPPAEMARLFRDLPAALASTEALGERLRLHDGRSRLSLSRLSRAAGRDARFVSPQAHRSRRARAVSSVSRARQGADRARARSHRAPRSRRLLPDRLGHRQFLPPQRHPRAGARLGRQQRRLLQPRHHGRRSRGHGSAVRAVSVGRARRMARHRSRSAERRSPRAGDSARVREIRAARARR